MVAALEAASGQTLASFSAYDLEFARSRPESPLTQPYPDHTVRFSQLEAFQ